MRRIIIHLDRCYGCMTCEAACVTAHKLPGRPITSEAIMASFLPGNMRSTRIWVEARPEAGNPVPITCRHCSEPPCVEVCSIGALKITGENGTVINHEERCAGCWMCIMVCPFGAIDKLGKVAIKCDLCQDRDTPACVEACPNEALEFVEVELVAERERERFASIAMGRELG
jgi:carbon-monoxide dehydrogenase iron sulfur subunit